MDRLDKPLDQLVKDSKADAKTKSKKPVKKAVAAKKKPVPVKASGKKIVGKAKPVLKRQMIVMPRANNIVDRLGVGNKPKVPKQSTGSAVVFSNLAYNITMEEMKELCSTIGNCGRVIMDVKGKADVMFFNKLDAITAVKKFNGLTLDGRPMQVALKDSTMSRRGDPSVASKALLFGSNMGGGRDQGYGRGGGGGPSFSVTMGGGNKQPKKKTVVVKPAPKKKAAPKKADKPKKEAPAPKSSEDLNMEMDSYFANRPAKATE